MSSPETTEAADTMESPHPNVRIAAREFGPVAEGEVELRPLTVFVGPSNTGKTYLAVLIYALHRILGGFPKFPLSRYSSHVASALPFSFGRRGLEVKRPISDKDLQRVVDKLNTEDRPFKLSDLPKGLRDAVESDFNSPNVFGAELTTELQRCFDIESVSEVIQQPRGRDTRISLTVSDAEGELWRFDMKSSREETTVSGRVRNMVLLPRGRTARSEGISRRFERVRSLADSGRLRSYMLLRELLELVADPGQSREAFYLPAVRSGIMQSHRVIASALVARSTRAGFERIPQVPTFSGGVADFMQRLILFEEEKSFPNEWPKWPARWRRKSSRARY